MKGQNEGSLAVTSSRKLPNLMLVSSGTLIQSGSRVRSLKSLLLEAEKKLDTWREFPGTPQELATNIFDFLRMMLRQEVGTPDLEAAMGLLFHELWGSVGPLRLLSDLYFKTRLLIAQKATSWNDLQVSSDELLLDFEHCVNWYGARKTSLIIAEEDLTRDQETDGMFGWRIAHDRSLHGLLGFDVVCGLRLSGHAGDNLWLKVFFKEGNRYLKCSSSWIDQAGAQHSTRRSEGKVCSVIPLAIEHHRVLIDEVRLFLPYQALNLQPGKQTLEVVTVLADGRGKEILSHTEVHNFFIPGSLHCGAIEQVSPQLKGVWNRDFSRGDGFLRASTERSFDTVNIVFDVELIDRDNGPITFECVGRGSDGFELPLELKPRVVEVSKPYVVLNEMEFAVPLTSLISSVPTNRVFCDLYAKAANGEILFGTEIEIK